MLGGNHLRRKFFVTPLKIVLLEEVNPVKTFSISLFVVLLCGAIIFISTTTLRPQTRRGMKISVRTSAGEHIELYNASYALVIGNGNYTNGWDLLPGALQDVKEVAEALQTHDFNVTLKTDLTADEFEDAFLTFVLEHGADENNRLLFYYAGHGYTLPLANAQERGYLVMVDAPEPDTDKLGFVRESVNMETLVGESKAILARHVLFLFDCCFSGTILNARDRVRPESISDNIRHPVRQFITAGRANEPVPDRSVFKTAFLDLIEGRAAEPFRDGYITGAELGLYLKNQVPIYNEAQHPQYGKIRDPKLDKGDFVFVLPRGAPPPPGDALSTIAMLNVTSTPSGATVYLNGIIIGKTPLRSYQIETGVRRVKKVEIQLALSGYRNHVRKVTLKGGQNVPLTIRLSKLEVPKPLPTLATLRVTSTPNGASVYLDGAVVGKTPLYGFEVDTGTTREKRVEIGIEFAGYTPQVRSVVLKAGQEVPWDVQLEKRAIPQQGAHPSTIWERYGAKMVLIPAGDFQMGSNDSQAYDDEKPVHTVYVDAFYMDTYEVTNAQFKAFINANLHWQKDKIDERFARGGYLAHWDDNNYPSGKSNHPVTHVSWYAAMAYAQWAGKRLPTEAEWEKAARGGLVGKKYPWGNAINISQANYEDVGSTMPVAMYAPNGYGLYDMTGNVWEWCLDAYEKDFYARSPRRNPLADEMTLREVMTNYKNVTTFRVLRGGGWNSIARGVRVADRGRGAPTFATGLIGFRCARGTVKP